MVWLVKELWEIPDEAFSHWSYRSQKHLSLSVGSGFLAFDCIPSAQVLVKLTALPGPEHVTQDWIITRGCHVAHWDYFKGEM